MDFYGLVFVDIKQTQSERLLLLSKHQDRTTAFILYGSVFVDIKQTQSEKTVDEMKKLRYNAILQGYILTKRREVFNYVENISAKEAPQKKGARFQKENVNF